LAAKPARLTKNRHGIYCLRWVVPLRFRDKSPGAASPREIRISLRTADPQRARILALEFNLALERMKATMRESDPRLGLTPMTVTMGSTQWDIRNDDDRQLFDRLLRDNDDLRSAMLQSTARACRRTRPWLPWSSRSRQPPGRSRRWNARFS